VDAAMLTDFLSQTQSDDTWKGLIAEAVTKCDNAVKSKNLRKRYPCKINYGVSAGAAVPKFDTCDGKPLVMVQCIQGALYAVRQL
jgi:hypothetical protein